MLLNKLVRRARRTANDDSGFAMIAVIALAAVVVILIGTMSSSVVNSFGYSSSTRAGIQSQSSAQAGIAAATAGIDTGTCSSVGGVYQSAAGATPVYKATIYYPGTGGSWIQGCPISNATQVRIVATGTATSPGTVKQDLNNTKSVESILGVGTAPTTIVASGPAIYSYSSNGFGGSGILVSVNGSSPGVLVDQGDVTCSGQSAGVADLVVNNGALTMNGSCSVTGTVWATGAVNISGGVTVGGSAIGSSVTISSGTVNGSVWTTGALTMGGGSDINGNATAGSLNFQAGAIKGSAWLYGAGVLNWGSYLSGNVTSKSLSYPTSGATLANFVGGKSTVIAAGPGASPYGTPATPTVPGWVDFAYNPSAWTGYAVAVLPAGSCSTAQMQAAVASFGTTPGIVDALPCTNGFVLGGQDGITLNANVAIFANQFNLGGSGNFNSTSAHSLWLINPDNTADGKPTCASGENLTVGGGFAVSSVISTMFYTPCALAIGSSQNIVGQYYGGSVSVGGQAVLGYTAVGLPGVNLSTGTTTAPSATTTNRPVISTRNITGG